MSTNGTNGTGHLSSGPIVRRVLTDSGVEVDVTPLSPHALNKLRAKALELYPPPDEERFRKPVPNAAVEGDTYIDRSDPEYVRLKNASDTGIQEFMTRALRDTSLSFPEGKEALIERFAGRIAALRALVDLPDDEWDATFWYAVIGTAADHETLIWAAENALPLTQEEVADGVRLFRYSVQGTRPARLAAREFTSARGLVTRPQNNT